MRLSLGVRRVSWVCLFTGLLIFAAIIFVFLPAPIEPAAWDPLQPVPLTTNHLLAPAQRLGWHQLHTAEDIALASRNQLYVTDGPHILRLPLAGQRVETIAQTGGQNLGLEWLNPETLVVANQPLGLFLVNICTKQTRLLPTPNIHYPNAIVVDSQQGYLYFTESSHRYYGEAWKYLYDLLEAKPYGSLYRLNLKTHRLTRLMKDLYYANGVALSPKKDYLLVNETYRYQIRRYWLTGPQAGKQDILINNLPGFPDGLSLDAKTGHYWAALYTIRNPLLDRLHNFPVLKKQLAKLPRFLWPQPKRYGLILELNSQGQIVRTLQDPTGGIFAVSSIRRIGDTLYLGSLHGGFIGKLKLPNTTAH